jgi:hypothetical protein
MPASAARKGDRDDDAGAVATARATEAAAIPGEEGPAPLAVE